LIPTNIDDLKSALNDGTLLVTGVRLWNAIHSESWRHREAAAQAFLDFLDSEKKDKYRVDNHSELLFVATLQIAKKVCEDKLL